MFHDVSIGFPSLQRAWDLLFLPVFGFDLVHVFIALQFPIESRGRICIEYDVLKRALHMPSACKARSRLVKSRISVSETTPPKEERH